MGKSSQKLIAVQDPLRLLSATASGEVMNRLLAALFVFLATVVSSASDPLGMLLLQGNKTSGLMFVAAAIVVVLYIMRRRRRINSQRRS